MRHGGRVSAMAILGALLACANQNAPSAGQANTVVDAPVAKAEPSPAAKTPAPGPEAPAGPEPTALAADPAADPAAGPAASPDPPTFERDACNTAALVDASQAERTLYWSCLGVALDVPRGLVLEATQGDLEGIVVEVSEDDEAPTIFGRIVATRLEWPGDEALRHAISDSAQFQWQRSFTTMRRVGRPRRGKTMAQGTYFAADESLTAIFALAITGDGLHQVSFAIGSHTLGAKALERRLAPLLKLRPMRPSERSELERAGSVMPDWSKELTNRRLPMRADAVEYVLLLCADGRYRTLDATTGADRIVAEIPARGTWRVSHTTIAIDDPKRWRVGALAREYDRFEVGDFGRTIGLGPFDPLERCP